MYRKRNILVLILTVVLLIIAGCGEISTEKKAEELFRNGKYEKAQELYEELGMQDKVIECVERIAQNYFSQSEYEKAQELYEELGLTDEIQECIYQIGIRFMKQKKYGESVEKFESILEYKDTKELLKAAKKKLSDEYFKNGKYERAKKIYKELGMDDKISECTYLTAKKYLKKKDYVSAIRKFKTIENYKDTGKLLIDTYYRYGIVLYDKSEYTKAIKRFEKTEGYKETENYLDKCLMERKYEKFDYESFSTLSDDSTDTMTNKEIRDYMESYIESMYTVWYSREGNSENIIIDKYHIGERDYMVLSWGGLGDYTEFDICYIDDKNSKYHVNISPDFTYFNVAETTPMFMSIGDKSYANYTLQQAEEYEAMIEEQMEALEVEYYMPGYAESASFSTNVYYAHWDYDREQKTNVIMVNCTITNKTDSDILFFASDFFSLNNNGIITSARHSDYDYTTIAPGGSFSTEIVFNCQNISRSGDIAAMTMIMEDTQIHLGPAPQDENEQSQLPGTYMHSSPSFDSIYIISDAGDGTYHIIVISDALGSVRKYENVEMDTKNRLTVGNGDFLWDSSNSVLYHYDPVEESYEKDDPYIKKNPIE